MMRRPAARVTAHSCAYASLFLFLLLIRTSHSDNNNVSPEALYRQTVAASQDQQSWEPFQRFAVEIATRFQAPKGEARLPLVGALEEGILIIEKAVFQGGQGQDDLRDAALSQLYSTYGQILINLDPSECLALSQDEHTLLIGAETVNPGAPPSVGVCRENAENALRNSISLDATNDEASQLLAQLTGEEMAHARKPKEFVAALFDDFAASFDSKLHSLEYRVPQLMGETASTLLRNTTSSKQSYHAVLDAGCGTGLAGRFLRPLIKEDGILVGVDASSKMLDIAQECTRTAGCGISDSSSTTTTDDAEKNDRRPLYDKLWVADLEDMTLDNTLYTMNASTASLLPEGFDLVVAADVLVYFGDLQPVLSTFASVSIPDGMLLFSCELATPDQAPLGWRLLSSGRFAHTQEHAVQAAAQAGYQLQLYKEIVPRMEKGEPVRGHLFGFVLPQPPESRSTTREEEEL